MSNTPKSSEPIIGYRIIDTDILNSDFAKLLGPVCKQMKLFLKHNVNKKKGLASSLTVVCSRCDAKNNFFISSMANRTYNINNRIVYAMRSSGKGFSGIEKFANLMDVPKPMTKNSYDKIVKKFVTVSEVANETMDDTWSFFINSKISSYLVYYSF